MQFIDASYQSNTFHYAAVPHTTEETERGKRRNDQTQMAHNKTDSLLETKKEKRVVKATKNTQIDEVCVNVYI